jgi:hypothetical protein
MPAIGHAKGLKMSYKVFLSYSWSNSAERRALQHELESAASVEVLVDSSKTINAQPLEKVKLAAV